MEKGDNCFWWSQKVKGQHFLVSRKITRLDFKIQLLNFRHNSLLDNENALLTFDLLGSSKTVIPFFHWALQLKQVSLIAGLEYGMKMEWKMEWNDECTQLQLTHIAATVQFDLLGLQGSYLTLKAVWVSSPLPAYLLVWWSFPIIGYSQLHSLLLES